MEATPQKILHTQAEVVEALGGPKAFAQSIQTARTAPYNYAAGVPFPPLVLCRVLSACAAIGAVLAPRLMLRLPKDVIDGIASYAALTETRHGKKARSAGR